MQRTVRQKIPHQKYGISENDLIFNNMFSLACSNLQSFTVTHLACRLMFSPLVLSYGRSSLVRSLMPICIMEQSQVCLLSLSLSPSLLEIHFVPPRYVTGNCFQLVKQAYGSRSQFNYLSFLVSMFLDANSISQESGYSFLVQKKKFSCHMYNRSCFLINNLQDDNKKENLS